MKLATVALSLLVGAVVSASVVQAAGDPGADREKTMKSIGMEMRKVVPMAQGKADYNAETAKAALETISARLADFPSHFPAGSEKASSGSLPAIWASFDDFKGRAEKASGFAREAAATTTLDTFKPAFGKLAAACQSCHEAYRAPN